MAIPKTFDEAFERVRQLSELFAASESAYLDPLYKEAEVRQEFIDKFFVALVWDVYHQENPNPYTREVRIEKTVQIVSDRGKRGNYAIVRIESESTVLQRFRYSLDNQIDELVYELYGITDEERKLIEGRP